MRFQSFLANPRFRSMVRRNGGKKIVKNFHRGIICWLHLWRKPRAEFRPQEVKSSRNLHGETRPWILGIHPWITRRVEIVQGSWPWATLLGVVGQKLRLLCMHSREFGARSPSTSAIINVIFGGRETPRTPLRDGGLFALRSFPAIKSRTVCDNNFQSIGDRYAYADYSIIVATCPDPIRFIVYIRKSD